MFNDVFNNVIHPMVTNFQQLIPQGAFHQVPRVAEQGVSIFGS